MLFSLLFNYKDKKYFGSSIIVYQSEEYYLLIVDDRRDSLYYITLISKDFKRKADIKDFIVDETFPCTIDFNVKNIDLYNGEINKYYIQLINSKGLNTEFTRSPKPLKNIALFFLCIFLTSFILTFIFKGRIVLLIILDVLFFCIMVIYVNKWAARISCNKEIEYFKNLTNKNLLDEIYLLQKEKVLKKYFKTKVNYIQIIINSRTLRPELVIFKTGNINYIEIDIDDKTVKYAVINNKIEEQDIPKLAFEWSRNVFKSIDEILNFIDSIDITKSTLNEDEDFWKAFELKYKVSEESRYFYPLTEKPDCLEIVFLKADVIYKYENKIREFINTTFEKNIIIEDGKHFSFKYYLDEDIFYSGTQKYLTNLNLDFLIYVSHENTITFVGDKIVSFMKEVTINEKEYWNNHELHNEERNIQSLNSMNNLILEESLKFGPIMRVPITDRENLKKFSKELINEQLQIIKSIEREVFDYIYNKYDSYNQIFSYSVSEIKSWIHEKYSWINENNIKHLVSVGQYYAWHG